MLDFKLAGVEEALANLKQIGSEVSESNLQADALEVLKPVVDDARSLAPFDEGDLRDSISAMVLKDGSVAVVISDWKGHFFEFGTVNMRAQPMLVPAFAAHERAVIESFGQRVGMRIEGAV